MTFQSTEGACAFAWRNYLLVHSGISEDDHRRSALHRYLTDLGDAGDFDFDLLQIAAVSYLKSLDELQCETCRRSGFGAACLFTAGPTTPPPLRPVAGSNDDLSNGPAARDPPFRAFHPA